MATTQITTSSHDTALCILPPRSTWPRIDRLRSRYDKAYGKWPPHINLVYPFVQVDALPRAVEAIQSAVTRDQRSFRACLDSADVFNHRNDNTIFVHDNTESNPLTDLRRVILESLGQEDVGGYRMHMTIGQSEDVNASWHRFLLQKANSLPTVEWTVDELHVLVRERSPAGGSEMRAWATISLEDGSIRRLELPKPFYDEPQPSAEDEGLPYTYTEGDIWRKSPGVDHAKPSSAAPATLAVATYNVLAEFFHPPAQKRYPLIVKNILSDRAKADVLVLEEVTDDFLAYLLKNEDIRAMFPFCSWGPPDQDDVEPLPSHNNIVVLSNQMFEWESVPFHREHKGAVVVKFQTIGQQDDTVFRPLILAAVHLTHGLKDGSITAKKTEVEMILKYLAQNYVDHPVILTGDFNITTSSYTITQALEKNAVSSQAVAHLRNFDRSFLADGFVDTWAVSRLERGTASRDDLETAFEGEQGATYDPTANPLAAEITGSGFNMRPQRYDRILVKGDDYFKTLQFNQFGFLTEALQEDGKDVTLHASDHWGVRAILRLGPEPESQRSAVVGARVVPVQLKSAQNSLADPAALLDALKQSKSIPSEEEIEKRASAFKLLQSVITEPSSSTAPDQGRSSPQLIVVPVGSYGLGVWNSSSDIDCLCIGPFSPSTFFALTTQRLRKASGKGIRVIRRVKAFTGIMLELDVQGVMVDLQYAPSHAIAENWPGALEHPASSPVWALSAQTLNKFKPVRDLDYVRRSVPDITNFRLAHRLIKEWAKRRGIYAAKYGYLSGIQITILLARVYKLLAHEAAVVSIPDLLTTFFNHYANFDWKKDLAFDPFFHKQLNYRRTDREPMAIIGYFPPALNTCTAASVPSVRTITEEFQRADRLLHDEGMTWAQFLAADDGNFLQSFKRYIKIDVQFWGGSLTKGRSFVGWLESRCVSLLVDLKRRLPELHVRFWPARFVEKMEDAAEDDDQGSYQGFYLIGIDKPKETVTDERVIYDNLITTLARFGDQIRGDKNYFDERNSLMTITVAKAAEVKSFEIDHREWGRYTTGDDESDDDDDEDEEAQASSIYEDYHAVHTAAKKSKTTNSPRSVVVTKPEGAGKFRTAADVLNRLRWDPALDSGNYVVGYEDRFAGAMEKGLDIWKSEQTDDEFIPQHRILYFKRRSDGVVVWDRMTRTDLLFGSGGPAAG
ncbi:Nuclear poly(A) polymerase 1 [Cytospora mali]|uniref:polynucleotide adenylyltransferase n=1 Tax=Cytospora mali TaxID=578113 RepID=A0A194UU88_CYTMA|nr:Nuclear poly(A) polymerase 1 [Valsa mali var. pyri (nom. inval.)]